MSSRVSLGGTLASLITPIHALIKIVLDLWLILLNNFLYIKEGHMAAKKKAVKKAMPKKK